MVTFKVIIYGIDMEKLHPFSLALIISNIYCLDSLKMFEGGGLCLCLTMSKPQMLWRKTDWRRKTTSGYRISDQNVPKVLPRNRQILAGLPYKRREIQTSVFVLADGEQEPPL